MLARPAPPTPLAALLAAALAAIPSIGQADTLGAEELPPAASERQAPEPIFGGSPEPGHPEVIALGADIFGTVMSMCTGSLITPKIVLSAAHCGDNYSVETIVALGQSFFGQIAAEADFTVGFEDAIIHPDYVELTQPTTPGEPQDRGENDFSLFILAEPVTDIEPLWFRREPLDDSYLDTELLSVGFGITTSGGDDGGVRRSAALTLDTLSEMFILSYGSNNPNNANVCSGDSGGPMMHLEDDGRFVQWAVHSWSSSDCSALSGSTRVDLVSDWILDQIEAVHGSRDVCEINGYYGNGVCDEFCAVDGFEDPDCAPAGDDDDDVGEAADDDDASASPGGAGCQSSMISSQPRLGWLLLLPVLALPRRRQKPPAGPSAATKLAIGEGERRHVMRA